MKTTPRRVIFYFGSFNPPHNGHMAIGRYAVEHGYGHSVVYVVSPQSPFKDRDMLAPEGERLKMVELAIAECRMCSMATVSDVEFHLPRPSYTYDAVSLLRREYAGYEPVLMIGSDNVAAFDRWHRAEELKASLADIIVYPRGDEAVMLPSWCRLIEGAPLFDISSTELRRMLSAGEDVGGLMPRSVCDYIARHRGSTY
ncbi:MAG: nicotinate (nicotinamide) nucleotide adenylyltransferase [Rikenellaceae bacterium]|nr:nicotinate (nicotinamide) nucleotide adenylyltransferase [Rikenellaceae bacterium]MDE7134336.1 nicotinate (nicotinamide) nucleotide adenylyltransferase [Rikenellaceae bacterium]MDE7355418.1 nicotinate (nicotinamide) nucleotide adenylyltransferase [Rikenellaceae bacterium]